LLPTQDTGAFSTCQALFREGLQSFQHLCDLVWMSPQLRRQQPLQGMPTSLVWRVEAHTIGKFPVPVHVLW
jgi:hypothetical protein